jgi:Xaa-Pro aminopeptidase
MPWPVSVIVGRLSALRRRMTARRIRALVVARRPNVAYLTGFEGLFDQGFSGMAVVTWRDAALFTDKRYDEQAAAEASGTGWRVVTVGDDLAADVGAWARAHTASGKAGGRASAGGADRSGSVAIEPDVSHRVFLRLAKAIGGEPVEAEGLVEGLRRTKDDSEIETIREAARVTDKALKRALGLVRPGIPERELAFEVRRALFEEGSDGVAFEPIVASGPNGSKPHAHAGERRLEAGDLVTIDMGARVRGYCADLTRTVALGRVDEERAAAYGAVLAAQKAALAAVRAGMTGRELDAVARRSLAERGLARAFTHGLGHGVGLEVHELPWVGRRGGKRLKEGDVITIEPGAYLPGRFGVRIEDLVVLTRDGVDNLSGSPKELITL